MLLICLLHEVFSVRLVQWQLCWFLKSPCRGFKRLHRSETWRDSGSTFVNGAVLLSNNAWLRVFDTEIRNIHTAILSGQDGGRNPQKMWSWAESRILRNVSVMNIRRDFLTISWNYSDCSVSFSSWCNPETFYLLSYSKKFLLICLIGRQKTEIWTETELYSRCFRWYAGCRNNEIQLQDHLEIMTEKVSVQRNQARIHSS